MEITYSQILQGLGQTPIKPTIAFISQGFGLENTYKPILHWYQSMGLIGHNGIDYACPIGTILKAPIDFTVTGFNYEHQDPNGYGTMLRGKSKDFEVNGGIYAVEINFVHLSDFLPGIAIGQEFKQGEDCCISGNSGKLTTGAHLHQGFRTLKKQSNGGYLAIDRDNGYNGYWNQLLLTNKKMRIIKGSTPHIYLITGDNKKKIMLVDFPTLESLGEPHTVVSDAEIASYEDGGTMVWVNRIIN